MMLVMLMILMLMLVLTMLVDVGGTISRGLTLLYFSGILHLFCSSIFNVTHRLPISNCLMAGIAVLCLSSKVIMVAVSPFLFAVANKRAHAASSYGA